MASELIRTRAGNDTELLNDQISGCRIIRGKRAKYLREFLLREGIISVDQITPQIIRKYGTYLTLRFGMGKQQQSFYLSAISHVQRSVLEEKYEDLLKETASVLSDSAARNKLEVFLMLEGIRHIDDIDYSVRKQYAGYLEAYGIAEYTIQLYMEALDRLKLKAIRKKCKRTMGNKGRLKYKGQLIFLLYHPDIETALTFLHLRDKEEAVFDFSAGENEVFKKQIFDMLCYALETEKNIHNRRQRFLFPLKILLDYGIKAGIESVDLMEEEHERGFVSALHDSGLEKGYTEAELFGNIRKYTFLHAKEVNWRAGIWYLDRFTFKDYRMNESTPIRRLSFLAVKCPEGRALLQDYVRYQLTLTERSIAAIQSMLFILTRYLEFLRESGIQPTDAGEDAVEKYLVQYDSRHARNNTYNQSLHEIHRFCLFLWSRGYSGRPPFDERMFRRPYHWHHNDRSVSGRVQSEILKRLKYLPMDLRLMFLNLWATGLRVNEICQIKAGSYFRQNGTTWLRTHQNKLKTEKVIPIPCVLYELMTAYISDQAVPRGGYVFPSRSGGPYRTEYFVQQMREFCIRWGITDENYHFRSHDFRHSIATKLDEDGASLQTIRDFLGHQTDDMTKQYIDYVPTKIDQRNAEYFKRVSLSERLKERTDE